VGFSSGVGSLKSVRKSLSSQEEPFTQSDIASVTGMGMPAKVPIATKELVCEGCALAVARAL
jgi:hypothetical protein